MLMYLQKLCKKKVTSEYSSACGNEVSSPRRDSRLTVTIYVCIVQSTIHYSTVITQALSTCPPHTNSGCGKERRMLFGPR